MRRSNEGGDSRIRISNLKFQILDLKFRISDLRAQSSHLGISISDFRFQISDLRLPILFLLLFTLLVSGCASQPLEDAPATRPIAASSEAQPDYSTVAKTLGHAGVLHDGVYTVTIPRDDLSVSIEGMEVPSAAGIASVFNFYRCSCGKSVVIGQFLCAEYEANDVLLALQQNDILVCSVSPYLIYEKPRLLCVRFQSEGDVQKQATALKSALNWTAKHNEPPRKSGD